MRSDILRALAGALAFVALSCGSAEGLKSGDYEVGRKPEFYSAAYMWNGGDANQLAVIDRTGHTLQQFTLEPFAHVKTLDLALEYEKQGVVASNDLAYFLTIGDKEYAIIKADGSVIKNPLPLLGKIKSIAFDPAHHLAVISDEFQTMALLALTPAGDVQGSWKAGALFGENLYVAAGTMLADGRLVLSVGNGDIKTVAVVKVADSITAQAWQYTSFDVPDAKSISWIATVPDQPDVVMAVDNDRVLSLNVTTQAIVDQQKPGTFVGEFRDYVPHVVSGPSGPGYDVWYVGTDGKLAQKKLLGVSLSIVGTLLSPKDNMISLLTRENDNYASYWNEDEYYRRDQHVMRFRLSDGAGLDEVTIEDSVHLAITPTYAFMLYDSVLGKAVRKTYGQPEGDQKLEGYNFETFRTKYVEH